MDEKMDKSRGGFSTSTTACSGAQAPFHLFAQARTDLLLFPFIERFVFRNHADTDLRPHSPHIRLARTKLSRKRIASLTCLYPGLPGGRDCGGNWDVSNRPTEYFKPGLLENADPKNSVRSFPNEATSSRIRSGMLSRFRACEGARASGGRGGIGYGLNAAWTK